MAAAQDRLPDGQPDVRGHWAAEIGGTYSLTNPSRGQVGRLRAEGKPVPKNPSRIVDPADGEIPYLPAALERRRTNRANRWTADPEIKCYMPGVPRANYMSYPFQIVQGTDAVMFTYEFADAVRIVHMTDVGEAPANSWMGWNVGRWDGDTLVVDVTAQHDDTWLDRSGNYHSDALHVVERYTLRSPDVLLYEATLEDPNVYSRPWTIRMPLYRHVNDGARLGQFKCVEFVEELMYGHLRKEPLQ